MKKSLVRVIYLSFATAAFKAHADDEIEAILRKARLHNSLHAITGQLIYRGGIFVQLLEGRSDDVQHLLGRILLDTTRHENMRILLAQDVEERIFSGWSMAYKKLNNASLDLVNCILPWQELIGLSGTHANTNADKIVSVFETLKTSEPLKEPLL